VPALIDRLHESGTGTVPHYLRVFGEDRATRVAQEPTWLRVRRAEAISAFERLGFPSTKDEAWRFTNVSATAATPFSRASRARSVATPGSLKPPAGFRTAADLVFVNGTFEPGLSSVSTEGVWASGLGPAIAADSGDIAEAFAALATSSNSAFTALNTALFVDAAVVRVAPGLVVPHPIRLVFVSQGPSTPTVSFPRVLVLAGAGSQVQIVETYVCRSEANVFTDAVSEIVVGDRAAVEHYRVAEEPSGATHIGALHVRCGRDSTFSSLAVGLGGSLIRCEASVVLDGEGATCDLDGLQVAGGHALVDSHTTVIHAKPHGTSHQLYKTVLGGQARGVFNGRIVVRPDAQKTDARQANRALVLSDDARFDSKPQLEILANDVKCTHGAAVGQLDDDAVFYLQARGLSADAARRLLIDAFVGEVLGRIRLAPLRRRLELLLASRVSGLVGEIGARQSINDERRAEALPAGA
jgi:Fe-S cluster assembly protein SufD